MSVHSTRPQAWTGSREAPVYLAYTVALWGTPQCGSVSGPTVNSQDRQGDCKTHAAQKNGRHAAGTGCAVGGCRWEVAMAPLSSACSLDPRTRAACLRQWPLLLSTVQRRLTAASGASTYPANRDFEGHVGGCGAQPRRDFFFSNKIHRFSRRKV